VVIEKVQVRSYSGAYCHCPLLPPTAFYKVLLANMLSSAVA
jgi:hypothetical protein